VNPAFQHGEDGTGPGSAAGRVAAGRWKVAAFSLGAVAVLAIAVAGWELLHRQPVAPPAPPMLLASPLGPGDSLGADSVEFRANSGRPSRTAFAFLPDGRSLVYVGSGGRLMVRSLDGDSATAIPGVEHAESPFVSPDGRWIGYWAHGHLRRIPVAGGASSDIAAVDEISGASWSGDDRIAVGIYDVGIVLLFPSSGAPPDTIGPRTAVLPQFLPDGRSLLFTNLPGLLDMATGADASTVDWIPVGGGQPQVLIHDAMDARYVPTGHLIFVRHGVLLGVRFDAASHTVRGAPFTVLPDVMQALGGNNLVVTTGAAQVAVSPLGQLAWVTGGTSPDVRGEIVEYDRQGQPRVLSGAGIHKFASIRISPGGDRLALAGIGRTSILEVYDLERGTAQVIPTTGAQVTTAWSSDGRRIFTSLGSNDSTFLASLQSDGTGAPRRLGSAIPGDELELPAFLSPGDSILYVVHYPGRPLMGIDVASGAQHAVPNFPSDAGWEVLSPDGKWLAYAQAPAGTSKLEVYVSSWPAMDRRWQVSDSGGTEPAWTRNGRELIFMESVGTDSLQNSIARVYAAEIGDLSSAAPGRPHLLFTAPNVISDPHRAYDVSADGSHFFTVRLLPTRPAPAQMYAMANWFTQLRALSAQAEAHK
jgi:eukaryotic-like serine/threonine-protein kinase